MGTGACGLNCDMCRLHHLGVCTTCGSGTSDAGLTKRDTQQRLFGAACPILDCAVQRKVAYCLRDCDDFPCDPFRSNDYPFSEGFLQMQKRRRTQTGDQPKAAWPENTPLFWKRLDNRPREQVCLQAGASVALEGRYRLQCLNETWEIDPAQRTITKVQGVFGGEWDRQAPFLILVYLAMASPDTLTGRMTAPRDLYDGQDFFQGKYALGTRELEDRFGREARALPEAAAAMGGLPREDADVSTRFFIFPKMPVDYLVWVADEEFGARVTILLDEGTPNHYPADACAVLVNLVTQRLLMTDPF